MLGGKLGAAASMRMENFGIAVSGILMALTPLLGIWVFWGALIAFLICRSTNNAMRFSLQKHIATPEETPAMLARNYMGLYAFTLAGSLAVALVLKLKPGIFTLSGVFIAGGVLFALTGWCIGRAFEPSAVKLQAAKPVWPQVLEAWRMPLMRHQIYVGCLSNLFLASVVPMNILAAKRGLGTSDSMVILLSALQAVAAVFGSVLVKHITARFGPRKMMIFAYPLVWLLVACWIFMPAEPHPVLMIVPFVLGGLALMGMGTPLESYFLITIPEKLQLGGTFLVFVVTGGLAGVAGIGMNWGVFKLAEYVISAGDSMSVFRFYYQVMAAVFALGIFAPWSLPGKADEYRKLIKKNQTQ